MKNWYLIPLAALLGLTAGTWGPRSDLKAFKAEQAAAAKEKTAEGPNNGGGFDAFAKMANIPDRASRRHRRHHADDQAAETNVTEVAETTAEGAGNPPGTAGGDTPRQQVFIPPEDLAARIDEAKEIWRTRVEIARTQWKGRLGVSGESADRFDAELDAMNDSLRDTMSALAQAIADQGRMTPELGLRMVGDASSVMAETYDRIAAIVPEGLVGEVSEMQVFEFIDPSVAEPLVEVQELMR